MSNSTHSVEVFRVEHLSKHPNADLLNILRVFDNYQAIVRVADFKVGDLACYVPPDNVLPDKPEYAFLKGHLRIKAQKLRGVMSQGLVLPAPSNSKEGDDVAEQLGITHYIPKISHTHGSGGGGNAGFVGPEPPIAGEKYDIDSWFRYGSLIPEGTIVALTEKIHGSSFRGTYQSGQFWASSRQYYRKEAEDSLYWRVMHENPWLKKLCKQNPNCVVYGEVFGNVQSLKYGAQGDQIFFRVFDILAPTGYMNYADKIKAIEVATRNTRWDDWKAKFLALVDCVDNLWSIEDFLDAFKTKAPRVKWEDCYVPILYVGPYSKAIIEQYISGPSTIPGANHLREGIVIKPCVELRNERIGRLILKAVSPEYLEKDKAA